MKKSFLKTMLLLIGMFCVSLFVMPAELTEERHSLQHQEAAVINVALSVDLPLIAFDALSQSINNEVIDMSKINNLYAYKKATIFRTEKSKFIANFLKKSGTVRICRVDINNYKVSESFNYSYNFSKDIEHRIRGVTTNIKTI